MIARIPCGCDNGGACSAFQDRQYGKGNRIANHVEKPKPMPAKGRVQVKCTCCSRLHEVNEGRLTK